MSSPTPLRFVVYYRTGLLPLDLAQQRQTVDRWGWFRPFENLAEYTEIEVARSKSWPQLELAISHARQTNSDVLIAYLGLLTQNVRFMRVLLDASRIHGVRFFACGFKTGDCLPLEYIFSSAEFHAASHSERTREGLAAAKARGVKIGVSGAVHADVARAVRSAKAAETRSRHLSIISKIRRADPSIKTFQAFADALTARGEKTPGGQAKWSANQVRRIMGPKRKKPAAPPDAPAADEKALRADDGKARVLH